ncbi:MAG TPA: DUF2520 domain-containing protein [Flavobacterium sp.]|jgi:predicted short-subunit dehydrogenase-like oxidoreductase (DUF2520 family)
MIQVSIIGYGNLAQHLAAALADSDTINLVQIFSRRMPADSDRFANIIINDISGLAEAHVYIMAVADSVIREVSEQLPFHGKLVVHTSGGIAMEEISHKQTRGVFYPLQTFTKNKKIDFSNIPICIECESADGYGILKSLADELSKNVQPINSHQRKVLHVAAVFANNFTNHLYDIANQICEQNQLPFQMLHPLIMETANKIQMLSPKDAQTGPAIRGDQKTVGSHLDFLQKYEQKNIYKILTQSIQDGKKL